LSQNLIQRHVEQSQHNEDFLQKILAHFPNYTDWIITITFYIAVHRVQAALLKDYNLYPDRHEHPNMRRSRNKLVQILYPAYWPSYYILYHESRKARYVPNYHKRTKIKAIHELIINALKLFKKLP